MTEYFTRNCTVCGREIITHGAENWVYKVQPPKGRMKYFCSWKCMRKYEAEHQEEKKDLIAEATELLRPKKQPVNRKQTAMALTVQIRKGNNPIDFLRNAGYGNPYEAYSAVRHYCATNAPKMLEILKPIKELNKYKRKDERK